MAPRIAGIDADIEPGFQFGAITTGAGAALSGRSAPDAVWTTLSTTAAAINKRYISLL
jgi:hypothetical protein